MALFLSSSGHPTIMLELIFYKMLRSYAQPVTQAVVGNQEKEYAAKRLIRTKKRKVMWKFQYRIDLGDPGGTNR